MAYRNESRPGSTSSSSEAHARLLYNSLEQYNEEQRRSRRPTVIFCALVVLFVSSGAGIALAIGLMAKSVEIEAASLSRDVILFAGFMSLLYICLHIRGARKGCKKAGLGPPQSYGNYLHASALLVARLSIITWIAGLVATAIMMSRALKLEGFSGTVPFLNMLICVGAIPSFLIISVTIERHAKPFATATISTPSFLTCRVSEFADDIATDSSVSRRSSVKRTQSRARSILTLPTELFWFGSSKYDEEKGSLAEERNSMLGKKAEHRVSTPMSEKQPTLPELSPVSPLRISPTLGIPDPVPTQVAPQPVYCPGGWRAEWNEPEQEAGELRVINNHTIGPLSGNPPFPMHRNDAQPKLTAETPLPAGPPSQNSVQQTAGANTSILQPQQQRHQAPRRPATASTSIASRAARSNLSTVRYASQPEIAVRQPIRVVRNPAYMPRTPTTTTSTTTTKTTTATSNSAMGTDDGRRTEENQQAAAAAAVNVSKPDPVMLLRNAQRAQKNAGGPGVVQELRRKPSNFSRPTAR